MAASHTAFPRFFSSVFLVPYRLLLGMSYCVIVVLQSVCSLLWFSCQYLPTDWLGRLLWAGLFVLRRLSPQRPGWRTLLCFSV